MAEPVKSVEDWLKVSTTIISNGSKWAGQSPDTIDTLIAVLQRETLDPSFERHGNFAMEMESDYVLFFGNFLTVSHVFNITSSDPDVIIRLRKAIRENQAKPEYITARKNMNVKPRKTR